MSAKVHIATSRPVGERCKDWVRNNFPGISLVEDPERCEILFSVLYNKLFPSELLQGRRSFNFHAGILPDYRGSGTINFAILNGECETGVTLHEMDKRIDHGRIIAIERFPIENTDTAWSILQKSEEVVFDMFCFWFLRLIEGNYPTEVQDENLAVLYSRADLAAIRDITPIARAFHFPGKPNAFYRNVWGEKVEIVYGEETSPEHEEFRRKYILPFQGLKYVYWPGKGYVVWRMSSGENAELLHVRTFVHGKGYSHELVRAMLKELRENPPYYSVFGFALSSKPNLKEIYRHLGFETSDDLNGIYGGGPAFIFHQSFEKLLQIYFPNKKPLD